MEDTIDALATVANAIAQGTGHKWVEEQQKKEHIFELAYHSPLSRLAKIRGNTYHKVTEEQYI